MVALLIQKGAVIVDDVDNVVCQAHKGGIMMSVSSRVIDPLSDPCWYPIRNGVSDYDVPVLTLPKHPKRISMNVGCCTLKTLRRVST